MEAITNLLMGEPVYDDNGKIVRRNFGIKNAVFILVIGYIGYSLMSGCEVKSGKRKMKGGFEVPMKVKWFSWAVILGTALATMDNDELVHGHYKPIYFVHWVLSIAAFFMSVYMGIQVLNWAGGG